MYELPPDRILHRFIGQRLVLVSCSANQVIFQFDGQASLVAEAPFAVNTSGQTRTIDVPLSDLLVLSLLEQEVQSVQATNSRRILRVNLMSGSWLEFYSEGEYESFHVIVGGDEFAV